MVVRRRNAPQISFREPKPRGFFAKLLGLVFSTLILFAIMEGLLRLFGVQPHIPLTNPSGPFVLDPDLKWRLKENFSGTWAKVDFKTNSRGLRDDPIVSPKPADEFRILILGGSITTGFGVARLQAYSDKLEALFKNTRLQKVNVINAGVPGYNIWQNFLYLKKYGVALEPNLILYAFSPTDIVEKYINFKEFGGKGEFRGGGAFFRFESEDTAQSLDDWENLKTRAKAKLKEMPRYTAFYTAANWLKIKIFSKYLMKNEMDRYKWFASKILEPDSLQDPIIKKSWDESLALMGDMALFSKAAGMPFLIHMFPLREQVQAKAGMDLPQKLTAQFAVDHQIPFLDLLPIFRTEYVRQNSLDEIYIDYEHPGAPGHGITSAALFEQTLPFTNPSPSPASTSDVKTDAKISPPIEKNKP